jgi:hypothetical protein
MMSGSTVIDLKKWRNSRFEPRQTNYASSLEMLALLRAFASIESSAKRSEVLRTVQEAASRMAPRDSA